MRLDANNIRSHYKTVQIVGPRLHHLAALCQVHRAVIDVANFVTLNVGELSFDHVWRPSHFIEARRSQRSEAVSTHRMAVISQSSECRQHGVLTHRTRGRTYS